MTATHTVDHIHDQPMSEVALRSVAIEALLAEKGLLTADQVQEQVDRMDRRTPADGARVVARAWADDGFKARLLNDSRSALAEMGIRLPEETPHLTVVENTENVHHVVVCTLCSCYPRMLLGRPPDWYKSLAYRARAVRDPRGVMAEFGAEPPADAEVRVLDSTADMRYLVLPRRPAGTEGMSEEELAGLVTRDSMIGVTGALQP
ncbi:MAG: nitrile hydratase subunit alpha [Dehalococcoidia bacterium]|nr:nitrile hydratase subunit alpha [Dehalococcoidia bacterium]